MGLEQPDLQSLYLSLAAKDRDAARLEVLENVRRKHLISAETWDGLARLWGETQAERHARGNSQALSGA